MPIVRLVIFAIMCAAALWSDVSMAAPLGKDEANAFYGQCMKTPDGRISPDTQNEFCACKSAHMMQTMSQEDYKTLQHENSSGRVMLNKVLIAVHGPCLSAPLAEIQYNRCLDDPRVNLATQQIDRGQVCACMSLKIGEWLAPSGPDVMAQTISENPFVREPLEPMMEGTAYKEEEYEIMLDCFQSVLTR